ncbi:MAG: hypothetical protein VX899_20645 [Myxococcota bacterium]|nr:hypothetical protein [Myxococcota bacterium]
MRRGVLAWALIPLLTLSACSKDGEPTDSAAGPVFSELSDAEKTSYMAGTVTPRMAELFQAYDAEAYADFGCETCHSAGGDYSMPTDELINWEEGSFPEASDGPGAEFMHDQVLPEMKELLGDRSFSCVGCHVEG